MPQQITARRLPRYGALALVRSKGLNAQPNRRQDTAHQGVNAAEAAALHARVIVRDLGGEAPAELRCALHRSPASIVRAR